jgi:hypothetical protein
MPLIVAVRWAFILAAHAQAWSATDSNKLDEICGDDGGY